MNTNKTYIQLTNTNPSTNWCLSHHTLARILAQLPRKQRGSRLERRLQEGIGRGSRGSRVSPLRSEGLNFLKLSVTPGRPEPIRPYRKEPARRAEKLWVEKLAVDMVGLRGTAPTSSRDTRDRPPPENPRESRVE